MVPLCLSHPTKKRLDRPLEFPYTPKAWCCLRPLEARRRAQRLVPGPTVGFSCFGARTDLLGIVAVRHAVRLHDGHCQCSLTQANHILGALSWQGRPEYKLPRRLANRCQL